MPPNLLRKRVHRCISASPSPLHGGRCARRLPAAAVPIPHHLRVLMLMLMVVVHRQKVVGRRCARGRPSNQQALQGIVGVGTDGGGPVKAKKKKNSKFQKNHVPRQAPIVSR